MQYFGELFIHMAAGLRVLIHVILKNTGTGETYQ